MSWFSRVKQKTPPTEPLPASPAGQPGAPSAEVRPPWVEFPSVGPDDFFWREAGQTWRTLVWDPFFNSLDEPAKAEYLARWKVPADWYSSWFDPATLDFWDHVDDPEE